MRQFALASLLIGYTQGLICFECDNAPNMEACKAQKRARQCNDNEKSCQQEIRSWGIGGKYKSISQRCKQKHACVNNHVQNPRAAWVETQCQPFTHPENSVCRCCCTGWDYCNGKEYAGCHGLKAAQEVYDEEQLEMAKTTIAPVTTKSESDENELTTTNNPSNNPTMPGLPTVEPTIDFAMMTPPGQAQPTCEWTQWTEWDKCSETCGGGQRNRYRNPIGGEMGSPGCEGYSEGFEYCATQDCEEKQCNDNYVDVCFLLPVSNSTTNQELRLMKTFVKDCKAHIGDFGNEDLQFCVYQYNSEVQEVVSLSDSSVMNTQQFKNALDRMTPLDGAGHDIGKAIDSINQNGFDQSSGWRMNDQIPSILVVLTDFIDDDSFYKNVVDVHNKAYRVVGVGIGENVNKNYLSSIVSKPTDENLFHVDTYEKLEDIVDEVGYDICQVDYWRDDACMFENGGCAYGETCFVQYNGRQCYEKVFTF